jgi:hypothetical protein
MESVRGGAILGERQRRGDASGRVFVDTTTATSTHVDTEITAHFSRPFDNNDDDPSSLNSLVMLVG